MDIDALRRLCLSFPGATEQVQWGSDLLFKVCGKMFAVTPLEPAPVWLSLKVTPDNFVELTERPGIGGWRRRRFDRPCQLVDGGVEPRGATETIDRLEPPCRDEPRARIRRNVLLGPPLERSREGVVHGFFRQIEIAEQPDQRRQHAARVGSVDGLDLLVRAANALEHNRIPPPIRAEVTFLLTLLMAEHIAADTAPPVEASNE